MLIPSCSVCLLSCYFGLTNRNNREIRGKAIRLEFGNNGNKKRNEGCYTCGSLTHFAKDCTVAGGSNNRNGGGSYSNNNNREFLDSLRFTGIIIILLSPLRQAAVAVVAAATRVAVRPTDSVLVRTIETRDADRDHLPSTPIVTATESTNLLVVHRREVREGKMTLTDHLGTVIKLHEEITTLEETKVPSSLTVAHPMAVAAVALTTKDLLTPQDRRLLITHLLSLSSRLSSLLNSSNRAIPQDTELSATFL